MTIPLDAPISVFRGSRNTTPVETLPVSAMLQRIQDGTYEQYVTHLRQLLVTEGKAPYDSAKRQSMGFTPAGVFTTRANAKLAAPSGLLNFDFDHPPDLTTAKNLLVDDPWIAYVFISPSGDGLKVAVWAAGIVDDTTYKHAWSTVLEYFERTYPDLAVANDAHCKDIARLCYTSWDPEAYSNPDALLYAVPPYQAPAPKPKPIKTSTAEALPADRRERYARQALDTAVQMLDASLPPTPTSSGTRHETRLRAARLLGGYVAGGILTYAEAYAALQAAVARNTNDVARSMKTVEDGLQHGQAQPITLDQLEAERLEWLDAHRATLGVHRRPAVPDMTGPPAETQDAPAPDEEPPLDEHIYGAASRQPRDPDALPYSDYTNALAFVRDHGANLRYCFPWGKWLAWTGTHWQIDDTGRVMRWAKNTVKRLARHAEDLDDLGAIGTLLKHVKASLSTPKLKALVENAQSELPLPVLPEDLDRDHWLLNATNGTIDLRTGALQPHRREDLLTRCIPVAYDKDAVCPTWESFLERIMDGNANLIRFLQRAVGYALTGVIREHVLLILWGSGRNGKSTFLGAVLTLLGAYAMKAPSELLMVSYNDRHPTERADLFHKRFVATIETEQGRRMAEVFVKEATGGDKIRARRMREDFWEFDPTHKLFLATNHKPVIKGTDTAIWERMKLVRFTVTIPPGEIDTTLPDQLEAELPGILNWAVRGCLTWQKSGLGTPDEVTKDTAGYRAEMDVLGQFIEDCCLTGSNYRVKASDLYDAYKRWCEQQGETAEAQRPWGMALTERSYENGKVNGRSWWKGIALVPIDQTEQVDDVDHGRRKVGIKHKKNESREHYPENWATSSTSSTRTDSTEFDEGVV